jgi:hypothetical protein
MVLDRRPSSGGTDMTQNTSKQDGTARAVAIGFYKTNGELYRSGCSTATGQRF